MTAAKRYAVLFRTHIWDDYVERQYQRLKANIGRGYLYVLLDETNGPIETGKERVVSHTNPAIESLGLADAKSGNFLWYNGDYPLYFFYDRHPEYDYYVMSEYDVTVNGSIDSIVDEVAQAGAGLLALAKGETTEDKIVSCLDVYPREEAQKRLICIAVFSREAVRALFDKRIELSREYAAGRIRRWPFCENFIPAELRRRGFKLMELTDFGSTENYDWWPPVLERDLDDLQHQIFIHPVLDDRRYVDSALRIWRIHDLFDARSPLLRRLRKVPFGVYGPPLATAVRRRLAGAVDRRLGPILGRASHKAG